MVVVAARKKGTKKAEFFEFPTLTQAKSFVKDLKKNKRLKNYEFIIGNSILKRIK